MSMVWRLKQRMASGLPMRAHLHRSFVVVAGNALMAWMNGRIRSCSYRVFMSGDEDRYTLGLFSFSKGMIEAPPELVDDEHPLQFKPFDHAGLFQFIDTEEGPTAKRAYIDV
ncbi:hypothetical protein L1049_004019 [Liquidambar formosana]|uniref:Isopenicillin N synthase-like Fe(2+) 2OG dioxygenase domain-containing protein n=1 Tax=Liquidambar formosana TaxID=63359 RepID=A0AAP0WY08_LIQFO